MNRKRSLLVLVLLASFAVAAWASELRFYLRSEPKTFNPLMVADDASETIRYLTGGVLVRINRQTQKLEAELTRSWTISRDQKTITFLLRPGLSFSDGTPFTAGDVAYTMTRLMDPALHSPTGDQFRSGAGVLKTIILAPDKITITFPAPVAGLDRLFDQVAILSAHSPRKEMATLGPYYVADYKPGAYVYLHRNENYWKRDNQGRPLPYIEALKLEIQANRDIELMHFRRGDIQLINSIDADYFDRLSSTVPQAVHDAGPSLDSEQMWFNQVPNSPLPAYKTEWFKSRNFRRAISSAINREDLCRVVYSGHARPAVGPVSPANAFWFNSHLQPVAFDQAAALRLLEQDGFHLTARQLRDRSGHEVEFSIITNSGNRAREKMATMIQQDLRSIGITVHVVTLDFPSLIQRITTDFNYEAALLGFVNSGLDPNEQMNVWLSSSETHQWNPKQSSPATPWEAEIDRLMRAQAAAIADNVRKRDFDRVQEIVADQVPFIYLVNKNALSAVDGSLQGVAPVPLRPQTYWNIEHLSLAAGR